MVGDNLNSAIEATAIEELIQDASPQLGADLDCNGYDIQFDDGTGIEDDSGNKTLLFGKTVSATTYAKITNNATGTTGPLLASAGETNVDLRLAAAGTGDVKVTTGGLRVTSDNAAISVGAGNDLALAHDGSNSTITGGVGKITVTPAAGSVLELDNSNATVDNGSVQVTGDLDVDNISIDGNTVSSTSGDLQLKAVSGSSITFQDDADATKQLTLDFATIGSGTERTWTFPNANGTFGAVSDESIDSDAYVDGSIDNEHIADDAINSEHYADGSIDTAHIATNQIDETLMKDAFVADFTEVTVATGDSILLGDATDSGNTKRDTVQGVIDLVHGATAGVQTIWVPAAAMRPTSANGCAGIADVVTSANQPDMQVLDFQHDTADTHAQFQIMFPKSWDRGNIQYQVVWAGIAATTGVAWFLQGVGVSDNDSIDVAYGTAVVSKDDAQGAVEEVLVSPATTITIGGTPQDDDLCFFRIYRDISDGDDDMAGAARLLGVKILFTTDAENDA